jgi:hypothetical protein
MAVAAAAPTKKAVVARDLATVRLVWRLALNLAVAAKNNLLLIKNRRRQISRLLFYLSTELIWIYKLFCVIITTIKMFL